MNISVSSTFLDDDARDLILAVYHATVEGKIPGNLSCIISTREVGDDIGTDQSLGELRESCPDIPIICVSARRLGRLKRNAGDAQRTLYDQAVLDAIRSAVGQLPDTNVMLGDMIIKSTLWCDELPSLNLHPDLPLSLGGTEGMYWEVIGRWVAENRREIGGMMHLAVPTLDAGTPVGYFRLPTHGQVNGVNLEPLWQMLPGDLSERLDLTHQQVSLQMSPDHPLFQELRHAEAQFEPKLVIETLRMIAMGEISLYDSRVFDRNGSELDAGYDLTQFVVGDRAIWPGAEGVSELYDHPSLREG